MEICKNLRLTGLQYYSMESVLEYSKFNQLCLSDH